MDIWRAPCGSSSKRFTPLYCFILIIQAGILQLPDSAPKVIVLLYTKIHWILVSQSASDSTSLLQSPSLLVISSTRTFVRSIRQTSELSCSNLGGQYPHGPPNFSYMGAPSTHGGKRISQKVKLGQLAWSSCEKLWCCHFPRNIFPTHDKELVSSKSSISTNSLPRRRPTRAMPLPKKGCPRPILYSLL